MNRITRKRKFKVKHNGILGTNITLFGKQLEYKKGDIVIWKGENQAILRIAKKINVDLITPYAYNCAKSTNKEYDSLHYSNLRLATFKEVEYLGSLSFRLIK